MEQHFPKFPGKRTLPFHMIFLPELTEFLAVVSGVCFSVIQQFQYYLETFPGNFCIYVSFKDLELNI